MSTPADDRPAQRWLEMLGVSASIETDDTLLLQALDRRLPAFLRHGPTDDSGSADIVLRAVGLSATLDGQSLGPASSSELFSALFRAVLDRVDGFLVLHAAVLERDGRCLLITGPSGAGKTTLAMALTLEGFRLMSDDFAPTSRESGEVHPFPKALNVRPGVGESLADELESEESESADAAATDEDWGPACPVNLVLTLERISHVTKLHVVCREPEAVTESLTKFDGVSVADATNGTPANIDDGLLFEVDLSTVDRESFERTLANDARIHEYGSIATRPRGDEAELGEIARREALMGLVREMQNRRPEGALMKSIGGDPIKLVLEVARALGSAKTYSLSGGDPRGNAKLIADLWQQL